MGLAFMCVLAPAHGEKRVAVVIGNDRYANLSEHEQLQKAVTDARAVGGALKKLGFDVISGENVSRQALIDRLDEAVRRITPGDTVFFFFSGHGIAVDGANYILPADVPVVGAGQVTRLTGAALKEEDITAALSRAGARVAVVVLDACRNNPFASAGTRATGGEKGLAPREPPSGVFTLYSAGRGEAALDRLSDSDRNPNSVFTRVLLPALARGDLDLPAMAVEVREEVTRLARTVNHAQRPAYYDETSGGRIYLTGLPSARSRPGDITQPAPPTAPRPVAGATPAQQPPLQTAVVAPPVTPAVPAADPCKGPVTGFFAVRCAAPLTAAQERSLKPKDTFRECADCPEMVVVPAGSFTMGSPANEGGRNDNEGPQHVVTIARPFAVGKLHVTVAQYQAFAHNTLYKAATACAPWEWPHLVRSVPADQMQRIVQQLRDQEKEFEGHSWGNPGFAQDGGHPVVCLRWEDAKAYVDWLAKAAGKPYRLLTEAEWEYAARGQTAPGAYPRFWFGNDVKALCRYGNGLDQSAGNGIPGAKDLSQLAPCDDGYAYTAPAGHYEPNAFGLYDMFGNALQWTEDCISEDYKNAPDNGAAVLSANCGDNHMIRGGSWHDTPRQLRAAKRDWSRWPLATVGLRVARGLEAAAPVAAPGAQIPLPPSRKSTP
jgi:formylglycine-generating enzyme required for sulfatase activity